jgi:hypothetical protein
MGRVIVMNGLTLAGVMQGPGRPDEDTRDGFAYGGWAVPCCDEVMVAKMGERMGGDRAFLFGRRTYEDLLASWNAQGGPLKEALNTWIDRYEHGGLAALADHSHRPASCPHELAAEIQAAVCELRRGHPGWGPRRIEHQLARSGVDPVPARSSIYRCLKRHGLSELRRRRKRREEFRQWERERPMQLWQMDVMGASTSTTARSSRS